MPSIEVTKTIEYQGLMMANQVKTSHLAGLVTRAPLGTNMARVVNRLKPLPAIPLYTTKYADTVWRLHETSSRMLMLMRYFDATPLDLFEAQEINGAVLKQYADNQMASMWRGVDNTIYQAAIGSSFTAPNQEMMIRGNPSDAMSTAIPLPPTQRILANGTGMTKAKLIAARARFRKNEYDQHNIPGQRLTILYTSEMLEQILNDTTLTSADFISVGLLQNGDLSGNWLGFNWLPFERVNRSGNIATTVAFASSAIAADWRVVSEGTGVQFRADKSMTKQVTLAYMAGATRTEDEGVVAIEFVI